MLAEKPMRLFRAVAWAAMILGAATAAGGLGHTIAVVGIVLKHNRPYDPGVVLLFTTGGILLFAGLAHVFLGQRIRRGDTWPLAVSGAATIAFCVYMVLLIPLRTGNSPRILLALWSAYLLLLVWTRRAVAHATKRHAG